MKKMEEQKKNFSLAISQDAAKQLNQMVEEMRARHARS